MVNVFHCRQIIIIYIYDICIHIHGQSLIVHKRKDSFAGDGYFP